ncbi:hypothetical protein D3C87_1468990 [compost metagenome]
MLVDATPDLECNLDRVHHQPVAFQLHLPASNVKACDQLLIGARRCVGKHGLAELRRDGMEVDVFDEKHRPLPNSRHRLVGRIRLVDTQPDKTRIGNELRRKQGIIAWVFA